MPRGKKMERPAAPAESARKGGARGATPVIPDSAGDQRAVDGKLDAQAVYVQIPVAQLFEHPANRARLYGKESLEELRRRIKADARGIARHPLVVTPARDAKGRHLTVRELVNETALATNRNLAEYVERHPEMRTDERPAYFTTHGNHRLKVYRLEDNATTPVVVQEMNVEEQLIDLVNGNQGRVFSRLEIGRFFLEEQKALGQKRPGRNAREGEPVGVSQHTFAARIGKSVGLVNKCVTAAEVFERLPIALQMEITDYNSDVERFTPEHFALLEPLNRRKQIDYARRIIQYGASASQLKAIIDLEERTMDPAQAMQEGLPGVEIARYLSGAAYETGRGATAPPEEGVLPPAAGPDGGSEADQEVVIAPPPGAAALDPAPALEGERESAALDARFEAVTQRRPEAPAEEEGQTQRRASQEARYGRLVEKVYDHVRLLASIQWDLLNLMQGLTPADWEKWAGLARQVSSHYTPQFEARAEPVRLEVEESGATSSAGGDRWEGLADASAAPEGNGARPAAFERPAEYEQELPLSVG